MGPDLHPGTAPSDSPTSVIVRSFDTCIFANDAQAAWAKLTGWGPVVQGDGMVMVTGADEVDALLHEPLVFSSNPTAMYFGSDTGAIPLQIDPPEHVGYRRLLDPMFAPKVMNPREAEVRALTNAVIDKFIENGSCDFADDFAVPLPSSIFLALMGLPQSDLEEFLVAKDGMIRPKGATADERLENQKKTSGWINNYFADALTEREKRPTEDVLGNLVALEHDGKLSREESLNITLLLLAAGLDTVTDTLECSVAFLAKHPEHRAQLAADPTLIAAAAEELLRYETPVPLVTRVTMRDTELGGCPIAKDTRLRPLLAAINHDPKRFDNPETVDFNRLGNKHASFGIGVHRCVGSHLARLELRVALQEWHRRIPDYRIPEGVELRYKPSLREIVHLPLVFTPGPREG